MMLVVDNLHVSYPRTGQAVDGVGFTVEQGEAVAILGPNGAGKTTTVRSVTGFLSSERTNV
ncbi:MAG TPA: ATP-binding cassette domain-containing protein, partial [Ilumatobacteraceae bacterium]